MSMSRNFILPLALLCCAPASYLAATCDTPCVSSSLSELSALQARIERVLCRLEKQSADPEVMEQVVEQLKLVQQVLSQSGQVASECCAEQLVEVTRSVLQLLEELEGTHPTVRDLSGYLDSVSAHTQATVAQIKEKYAALAAHLNALIEKLQATTLHDVQAYAEEAKDSLLQRVSCGTVKRVKNYGLMLAYWVYWTPKSKVLLVLRPLKELVHGVDSRGPVVEIPGSVVEKFHKAHEDDNSDGVRAVKAEIDRFVTHATSAGLHVHKGNNLSDDGVSGLEKKAAGLLSVLNQAPIQLAVGTYIVTNFAAQVKEDAQLAAKALGLDCSKCNCCCSDTQK